MKSLDDMLAERALEMYQERLLGLMDVKQWTRETRDAKFAEIVSMSEEICTEAERYTMEILTHELEERSVLYWKMRSQFLTGQLEFLKQVLNEVHEFSEDELATLPVDYDWLLAQIRILTAQLNEEEERVQRVMDAASTQLSTSAVVEV